MMDTAFPTRNLTLINCQHVIGILELRKST
jgi:hypothetical protein